ncbi:MAG: DUF2782 domain-containing protein [Burkholderiales bacterium]|nr:DUF2782 domain-containing protein [Burkholderiales bacterium]
MKRSLTMVLAGLGVALLALPLLVVAAEPTTGETAAPPPPPIVDEKTAKKAGAQPLADAAAKPPSQAEKQPVGKQPAGQQPNQADPIQGDPDLEPQVTLIERDGETHEEVRVNGTLRYIKVTPKAGTVYYLVPVQGATGAFVRRESLDSGLRVPMWQILSW